MKNHIFEMLHMPLLRFSTIGSNEAARPRAQQEQYQTASFR